MSEEIIQKVGQYEVEEFRLQNNYGHDPIILSNFMVEMTIYEDIFSPTITAKIVVTTTGNAVNGKSIYNGLPLRGGERVSLKIKANTKTKYKKDKACAIMWKRIGAYQL